MIRDPQIANGTKGTPAIVLTGTAPVNTSVLWADTSVTGTAVVPLGGSTGQVLAKISTTDYATTWADPAVGFRNVLINGDFRVNQRGLTSTGTVNGSALSNGNYGHDRWNIGFSGGTVTYSSQAFATGNAIPGYEPTNYARVVTSGQSGGSYTQFAQRIENVRTFAGQTVTISFWAKADTSRNIAIELQQNFGSGGGSAGLLYYVRQVTLTTSWVRYSFQYAVPSISGKTIGTGNDSYLSFAPFFSAGTGFESRTGSLGIQNGTVEMWGVQIEAGTQPTSFEQIPIGVELSLCQRYYTNRRIFYSPCGSGGFGNAYSMFQEFPAEMRRTPDIVYFSGADYTGTTGRWSWYNTGSASVVAVTTEVLNTQGLSGTMSGFVASLVVGSWTANAEL